MVSVDQMHHALEVQEILLNIFRFFGRRHYDRDDGSGDLASLARTCRTFKEPALDILWEVLDNLYPLARCLPDISYQLRPTDPGWPMVRSRVYIVLILNIFTHQYAFRRPLFQNEWHTLRSYTRRIRSLSLRDIDGLHRKAILMLFTTPDSLLPNLRYLRLYYYCHRIHLLRHPLPSLTFLNVELCDQHSFHSSVKSVAKTSPNLKGFSISIYNYLTVDARNVHPDFICQWRNLNTVACYGTFLDMNTLVHLSRMPALTELRFALSTALPDQIASSKIPLIFSNLGDLGLTSKSLHVVSSLLSQTQLPTATDFYCNIESCPSRLEFSSFLASIQTSCVGQIIQELSAGQSYFLGGPHVPWDSRTTLGLGDLRPCLAFSNLCVMEINIEWKVDLTDSELLTLASASPRLERLTINEEWGWCTLGGITPNGLLQLLEICRSLYRISLAIDTRGYTKPPPSSAFLGLTLPSEISINVVDSSIEAESMPAIAAFFAGIASHSTNLVLRAWRRWGMEDAPHREVCKPRWEDVVGRVYGAVDCEQCAD